MKKVLIIYNPFSGHRTFVKNMDMITLLCNSSGFAPTFLRIDAINFDLVKNIDQYNMIMVAGGDGTLNEIVNMIASVETQIPIGIIPSGTANDFATFLGYPRSTMEAVKKILSGSLSNADIGKVNNRYFINVISGGVLSAVSYEVDKTLKMYLGTIGYYIKGLEHLLKMESVGMEIEGEGFRIHDEIMLFLVLNSNTAGGIKNIAPNARINDGLFDLVVLKKCSIAQMLSVLLQAYEGRGAHLKNPLVECYKTPWLKITSTTSLQTDIDGEPGPELPLYIENIANKIKLIM